MHSCCKLVITLLMPFLLAAGQEAAHAELVAPSGEFGLYAIGDASGGQFRLADFRGKVVLLEFWASWCARCREQISEIKALRDDYESGFETIAVNLDEDVSSSEPLLPQFGSKVILGFDPTGGLASISNIKELPGLLLVDAQGVGHRIARPNSKQGWQALRATIQTMVGR